MKQGIIIENISNIFKIICENELYTCDARGKLKKDDIKPVVGDKVNFEITKIEEKTGVIEEILPRKNYIKRPKIANINQIVLVISSKMPKPDLLMLDKQLVFAEYMNIRPVIVINKIDLAKEIAEEIKEQYKFTNYEIIETNAKKNIGIYELRNVLKNKISVFSGNSGVGKSTLLNDLFEDNLTLEGKISSKNERGKNTTTTVKLYELEENTFIADSPGFSTFDIYEIETTNLAEYFVEFKEYIENCEFVGCTHIKEENCGIKQALKENKISQNRYERYIKIYEELKDREEHKW
jgi:ribosome biogenesis GTPase